MQFGDGTRNRRRAAHSLAVYIGPLLTPSQDVLPGAMSSKEAGVMPSSLSWGGVSRNRRSRRRYCNCGWFTGWTLTPARAIVLALTLLVVGNLHLANLRRDVAALIRAADSADADEQAVRTALSTCQHNLTLTLSELETARAEQKQERRDINKRVLAQTHEAANCEKRLGEARQRLERLDFDIEEVEAEAAGRAEKDMWLRLARIVAKLSRTNPRHIDSQEAYEADRNTLIAHLVNQLHVPVAVLQSLDTDELVDIAERGAAG